LPKKPGASEDDLPALQPLYGEWQTVRYEAPGLIDGKVPRNEHGNVDVFQPSMLPKQCVHTTVPYAWKIAKHLGIDYAEACVSLICLVLLLTTCF
jgi:xeroderma pigmentosum group C-complementing protein